MSTPDVGDAYRDGSLLAYHLSTRDGTPVDAYRCGNCNVAVYELLREALDCCKPCEFEGRLAELGALELGDAKRKLRAAWEPKARKYRISKTDCYTDGFWGGRLWALARLIDAGIVSGDCQIRKACEALDIGDNEAGLE